jgi:hypothetical protein
MTDEEYFALLDRIVKGAYYLANPLITQPEYDKALPLYNSLCEQARKLRWG